MVDIDNRFLYLVEEGGKAMRYGIGVRAQRVSPGAAMPAWRVRRLAELEP